MSGTTAVILKGYPRLSETFIAQELRGLELSGYKLQLYSMRQPRDKKRHPIHDEIEAPVIYLPEYLRNDPGRTLKSCAKLMFKPRFWAAVGKWLGDLVREPTRNRIRRFGQACVLASELPPEVDRLYAHFIHTPAAVTHYASIMTGLPWTCSAHAKDIWTSPDWDLSSKLNSCEWVATCTAVGHAHLQTLSRKPSSVHLIYHGLDLQRFPHFDRQPAARDGQDPADPVRLFSVGRAVEKKGFDTLLNALAQLPDDLHWTWTHIGGGDQSDKLEAQARELGIADRINWLGSQSQATVLEHYRGSDMFILPCRIASDGDRDGLPNVLVEAQSQALACISTPISAVPELIDSEERGLLVPPDDVPELAAAIEQLCRNPEKRDRLGHAGEQRIRSAFDYNAGINQLTALFRGQSKSSSQRTSVGSTTKPLEAKP